MDIPGRSYAVKQPRYGNRASLIRQRSVARRHVVEPFDLPTLEPQQFWQDAMVVSRALSHLVRPAKINYEIHGNSMPHLQMHIFPRSADDPYVGRSIAWDAMVERSDAELRGIRDAIERERAGS